MLARRRTTLPFLVVALLGVRAALDAPGAGLLVAVAAVAGAVVVRRGSPTLLTVAVLLLALAATTVAPAT